MRILAINSATDALGVGIVRFPAQSPPAADARSEAFDISGAQGAEILAELLLGATASRTGHSERLMPAIAYVTESAGLLPADLDGVAVVAGPGGFTGIRSGLAAAKAIAQSRGIPVWGVDTLEALAASYPSTCLISPLLDARRGEVFAALYQRRGAALEILQEPVLLPLTDWLDRLASEHADQPIAFLGEGATRYPDTIAAYPQLAPVAPESHLIRPATIARLAASHLASGGEDPIALVPRYHRAPAMAPQWVPNVGTKSW